MNCPKCGLPLPEGSTFCNSCGTPLASTEPQGNPSAPYGDQQSSNQDAAPGYATPNVDYGNPSPQEPYQQQQQQYQQQPYQQQYQQQQQQYQQAAATQKVYAYTTGISRALGMSVYWGLLPLIFAWIVADKDNDPFIRHHLNQALVIFIGSIIAALLMVILIGSILGIFLFVMVILGTIQAYHGEVTELPLIGKIKILK